MNKIFLFLRKMGCIALIFSALPTAHAARTEQDYEDPIFREVVKQYGSLKVEAGSFESESEIEPWSAWWYPYFETELFQSKPDPANPSVTVLSPLEKYDLYVLKTTGVNPGAAAFEKKHLYNPSAEHWAGRCNAWSLAAIISAEPKAAVRAAGVDFSVSDLKALLIKTYENAELSAHFGQINHGQWDSVYKDVYPDQFHRFLQVQAFDKHLPFIIDHDAGVQIWNVPVWAVKTVITADRKEADVMHVKTTIVSARADGESKKNHGYVGTDPVRRTYTYDLIGVRNSRTGMFHVRFGEWTGDSRWDHPDYLIPMPEKIVRKSLNEKLDPKIVDQILRAQAR